jgi:hypothetical protein
MQVMDALIRGRISTKISGQLLYGLQIASSNLWQGANFEQGKSATVVGSYDSFEQDYDLADTDCELTVAEEKEVEAVVEDHSELARAVREVRLAGQRAAEEAAERGYNASDPAKDEGEQSVASSTPEEVQDELGEEAAEGFHCNRVCQFLCSIDGPLAERARASAHQPQRVERDAVSQRLVLRMQPQSVGARIAEESREVA